MTNILKFQSSLCLMAMAISVIIIASGVAEAGMRVCGERTKLTKFLNGKYKENPRAVGVSSTGKAVLEVYTSLEGSWTVLLTTAKGMTCIMGAGHSWEDKDMAQYLPKS